MKNGSCPSEPGGAAWHLLPLQSGAVGFPLPVCGAGGREVCVRAVSKEVGMEGTLAAERLLERVWVRKGLGHD